MNNLSIFSKPHRTESPIRCIIPWRFPWGARRPPLRRTFALIFLLAVPRGGAAPAFVYESAYELQSDGDFDGDGRRDLIIVDKATGNYRIGYQLSVGSFTWDSTRASGIANATSLAIGRLDSLAFDSFALTGPDANRLNILDANDPASAALPLSAFIPALGPNAVAAIDIGGADNTPLDDLYVASMDNGVSAYRETLLRTNATSASAALADNAVSFLRERINPVLLHTNRAPRLALFERNTAPNSNTFRLFDTSSGAVVPVASVLTTRLPTPSEYVTGQFDTANPYTQVLTCSPSTSSFNEYQVTEPTPGTYTLVLSGAFTLTNVIDRLFVLPATNGLKLLALDVNGVSATVYAFDGTYPPAPVQAFNAAPGEHFTGAGILGNGGFTAYSAPVGQNTSAKFRNWTWNGAGFTSGPSGDLPRATAYSAAGNVMQFEFEPLVANNPVLLRLNNAGDWAATPAFSGGPGNLSVSTETFASSSQGLVNPTNTTLGPAHPLAAFALANQFSNMVSLFNFSAPAGDKISDVTISPAPGLYPNSVQIQFTAASPADVISFRIGPGN